MERLNSLPPPRRPAAPAARSGSSGEGRLLEAGVSSMDPQSPAPLRGLSRSGRCLVFLPAAFRGGFIHMQTVWPLCDSILGCPHVTCDLTMKRHSFCGLSHLMKNNVVFLGKIFLVCNLIFLLDCIEFYYFSNFPGPKDPFIKLVARSSSSPPWLGRPGTSPQTVRRVWVRGSYRYDCLLIRSFDISVTKFS